MLLVGRNPDDLGELGVLSVLGGKSDWLFLLLGGVGLELGVFGGADDGFEFGDAGVIHRFEG